MKSRKDESKDLTITCILDEILQQILCGEEPRLREYLERFPDYRDEIQSAFFEEQNVKKFLLGKDSTKDNFYLEVEAESVWNKIDQEIKQQKNRKSIRPFEFKDVWNKFTLSKWIDRARKKDPLAITVVKEIYHWFQYLMSYDLIPQDTATSANIARVRIAKIRPNQSDAPISSTVRAWGSIDIDHKVNDCKKLKLTIDRFEIDVSGNFELDLHIPENLIKDIAEYPINIILESQREFLLVDQVLLNTDKIKIRMNLQS